MKLYRFTASNVQRAITNVNDELGPDALVYSTRKIPGGVEVLAGLPFGAEEIAPNPVPSKTNNKKSSKKTVIESNEIIVQANPLNNKLLEKIKLEIETINDSIQLLSQNIELLKRPFFKKIYLINFLKSKFIVIITFILSFVRKIALSRFSRINLEQGELTN